MNVHFNSYKVKYIHLNSFFRPIRTTTYIKSINIFINLDDLFHNLHRPLINNEFQVCGTNAGKQLLSNIFNLLGHYRNWAIKEHLQVKVYCIYTSNIRSFKNSIYNVNYRKKFKEYNEPNNTKYYFINEAINSSRHLFEVISGYIPDVYIIDSKYIEPSVLPLYIQNEVFSADWNFLISRDTYDLQYAYKDKWTYISPRGDKSKAITRKNMWEYINEKEKINKDSDFIQFDYNLYPLVKTIVGDSYRSIDKLRKIGWKTIFKYLEDITNSCKDDNSIVVIQNKLLSILFAGKLTIEAFNSNAYCVDVEKQLETMMEIDKSVILSQLKDTPDYENLKVMNTTYFIGCQLQLEFLCNKLTDSINKPKWTK